MKRDERLIEFSKEHHLTLRLGLALTRQAEDPKTIIFLDDNRGMLLNHFDQEEKALLPILEVMEHDHYKTRFLDDHKKLRILLNHKDRERYSELGALLIAHTRFEERALFEVIQNYWQSSSDQ